jgi:diguanylate cyclase (GGDEF)-like protein/PAS domain S-box-containing protein
MTLFPRPLPVLHLARHTVSLALATLGSILLAAWYLHLTQVLQWRPQDAPVQFNVALAFVICAAALAVVEHRRRLAVALGCLVTLIGYLTVSEYATGRAFGIDTLLFDPYLTVRTSTPGRMAPNAAICLILAGLSIACYGARRGVALAGVASLCCASIAGIAAVGYLIDVEMAYGWFACTRLDFPSALGLAVLGIYLTWHSGARCGERSLLRRLLPPLLVGLSMASITCVLWLSLLDAERQQLNRNTIKEVDQLIAQATGAIQIDLRALEHLRMRGERRNMMAAAWLDEAGDVVQDSQSLSAIFWTDGQLHVQRVASTMHDPELEHIDLDGDLNTLVALERARATHAVILTHLTSWSGDGKGLLAVLPMTNGGVVVGVFDARRLPSAFMTSKYGVELFDGEEKFYSQHDRSQPTADLLSERRLVLGNIELRVRVWPTPDLIRFASSWHAAAVLLAGLCMALLLASVTLLAQLSTARLRKLQCEIAERRKVEQENTLLMSELQVVFSNVALGVALVRDGVTVRCNDQYACLLGSPLEAIVGKPVAPNHLGACVTASLDGDGGICHVELQLARSDGTVFWAACSGKALDPSDPSRGMVWVVEDISTRKTVEQKMLFEAQHDSLTGLANRAKFASSLELALDTAARERRRMAVCYIDLDKFKYVNDTFGHDAGDHLLVTIAQRLAGTVRESDTVARLGGDEFGLVLPSALDREIVASVLDRVLGRLQDDVQFGDECFAVSGSIGMAMYPDDGLDAQTLLKHADEAMYVAKQGGRNNWRAYCGGVVNE